MTQHLRIPSALRGRSARRPPDGRHPSRLSLWMEQVGDDLSPRAALPGDLDVDVAIVGAGYTGLWTARSLLVADPGLRVVVLEAETAGYGASGRNGGWCSALFPVGAAALARRYGHDAALALRRAMNETVVEVGRAARSDGVDCGYVRGGTVRLARTRVQLDAIAAELDADAAMDGVDGLQRLDEAQARARVGASSVLGGLFTPHCARIQPAELVRGLARAVEGRGAVIHERSPVLAVEPATGTRRARAVTASGTVTADVVVRATEAWTAGLPGSRRTVVPVYSLMVATEPLPAAFWDGAGLADRETFSDERHLIVYGQRTTDDRLAFGGRGAPYHFGSRIAPAYDGDRRVFAGLHTAVRELFPALAGHRFSHAWGGPIAIPRDWHASVGLDRATGTAWAGGYVGDGVATTNLAGRTLADLVLGRDTELTRLPWVGHRSPRWEAEPLRWLGVNAGLRAMTLADTEERLTGRPSRIARTMAPLLGH